VIHFDVARRSNSAESALAIMEQATELLEEQTKNPENAAYALVGLARGRISVLQRWWPEKVSEEWRQLRPRLEVAAKEYRENPEIRKALHEIPFDIAKARAERAKPRSGIRKGREGKQKYYRSGRRG
jgi:hypothetical protein